MIGNTYKGYFFKRRLGSGGFGDVFEAVKDNKSYAVKTIPDLGKGKESLECVMAENVENFSHPFLVKYYSSFKEKGSLFIVMELCTKGDLNGLIYSSTRANMSQSRFMKIFVQLILGLDYIHRNKILHRDIKAGNIFINEYDDIKIGDFGLGKIVDTSSMIARTKVGTPCYEPPEIIQGLPYDGKADVWSAGVVMYELITGRRPFTEPTALIGSAIISKSFAPIGKNLCDARISDIVHSMLNKDPRKRPSFDSILKEKVILDFAVSLDLLKFFV